MRWQTPRPKEISIGDKRIIKKFLIIPCTINGETRWLERAEIEQEAVITCSYDIEQGGEGYAWRNIEWKN